MCEMANIREHCSWIHEDRHDATAKAIDIGRMIVEKVKRNEPLEVIQIPVTKRALVIGGGIAGIQAAPRTSPTAATRSSSSRRSRPSAAT